MLIFEEGYISIAKSVGQITLRDDQRSFDKFPSIIAVGVETVIKIHGPASPKQGVKFNGSFPVRLIVQFFFFETKLCATNSNCTSRIERNERALNS